MLWDASAYIIRSMTLCYGADFVCFQARPTVCHVQVHSESELTSVHPPSANGRFDLAIKVRQLSLRLA